MRLEREGTLRLASAASTSGERASLRDAEGGRTFESRERSTRGLEWPWPWPWHWQLQLALPACALRAACAAAAGPGPAQPANRGNAHARDARAGSGLPVKLPVPAAAETATLENIKTQLRRSVPTHIKAMHRQDQRIAGRLLSLGKFQQILARTRTKWNGCLLLSGCKAAARLVFTQAMLPWRPRTHRETRSGRPGGACRTPSAQA